MNREKGVSGRVTTIAGGDEVHRAAHSRALYCHQNGHPRFFQAGKRILQSHAVMAEGLGANETATASWAIQSAFSEDRDIHARGEMTPFGR
jgi:hypothetical protein